MTSSKNDTSSPLMWMYVAMVVLALLGLVVLLPDASSHSWWRLALAVLQVVVTVALFWMARPGRVNRRP